MTLAGNRGDEFINRADDVQWVHDGAVWQERPFVDRFLGRAADKFVNDPSIPNTGSPWMGVTPTWTELPGAALTVDKVDDASSLLVYGQVTGWSTFAQMGGGSAPLVFFGVFVTSRPLSGGGGVAGPESEIAGHIQIFGSAHRSARLSKALTGIPKGRHTIKVSTATDGDLALSDSDFWSLTAWEVGL